jgi:hypothetical protein
MSCLQTSSRRFIEELESADGPRPTFYYLDASNVVHGGADAELVECWIPQARRTETPQIAFFLGQILVAEIERC